VCHGIGLLDVGLATAERDPVMLRRITLKVALVGLFVLSLIVVPACSQSTAEPAALTGDSSSASDSHERHATGMDSQVADM